MHALDPPSVMRSIPISPFPLAPTPNPMDVLITVGRQIHFNHTSHLRIVHPTSPHITLEHHYNAHFSELISNLHGDGLRLGKMHFKLTKPTHRATVGQKPPPYILSYVLHRHPSPHSTPASPTSAFLCLSITFFALLQLHSLPPSHSPHPTTFMTTIPAFTLLRCYGNRFRRPDTAEGLCTMNGATLSEAGAIVQTILPSKLDVVYAGREVFSEFHTTEAREIFLTNGTGGYASRTLAN